MQSTTIQSTELSPILEIINSSNQFFRQELLGIRDTNEGLTKVQYIRYLQMQYHLTKGVQKPFIYLAGHERTYAYKKLRKFLINFAYEEEMHFKLAENDLENLHAAPGEKPLDVRLWWAFYNEIIQTQPFIRLGATCILENIGNGTSDIVKSLIQKATYLTNTNTTFLRVHLHEELPHGDQIVGALAAETFNDQDLVELIEGAKIGFKLYSRMLMWALKGEMILK